MGVVGVDGASASLIDPYHDRCSIRLCCEVELLAKVPVQLGVRELILLLRHFAMSAACRVAKGIDRGM